VSAWGLGTRLAPGSGTLALKVLPLLAALPGCGGAAVHYRCAQLALRLYVGESLVRVTTERASSCRGAAVALLPAVVRRLRPAVRARAGCAAP
jgi:uncharacterized membrane protein